MTDEKFIDSILAGGGVMQKTIDGFYHENFGLVYQKINSHKLVREEAIDAYSDAVTAFVENIRFNKFRGESKCRTYFIRIFNNKCIDVLRKKATNNRDKSTIYLETMGTEPIQKAAEEDQGTGIIVFMDQLTVICREVLMDWSDGYSMDDIAERNGLKNAHTARSKRFNCYRQLMAILRKNKVIDSSVNMDADGE